LAQIAIAAGVVKARAGEMTETFTIYARRGASMRMRMQQRMTSCGRQDADLHDDLRLLRCHLDVLPQVASLAIHLNALLEVLLLQRAAHIEISVPAASHFPAV
jgi:hypothetical protein